MGILKKIKKNIERKEKLKILQSNDIINIELFDLLKKTIIFVSRDFPTHDKDSGSNRLKEIILNYKNLGYNCIILSPYIFEDDSYVKFYQQHGIIIFTENLKYQTIYDFISTIKFVDYVWLNGPLALNLFYKKLKCILSSAKFIYDMVDIHFLRYKRAIELEPLRISLKKNYKYFFHLETVIAPELDYVIAISNKEKEIMSQYINPNKIITISNIHYPKIDILERSSFKESKGIIFIGSTHEPNVDAVKYFYEKIMPIVWKNNPNLEVTIIGNVADKLDIKLFPKFNFLGFVENIEELFMTSKIMVAPLRFGAGVKGKIGQAFEYFLPVITTDIGAEGMQLIDEKNVLIANNKDNFAEAIIRLNNDEELWNSLSLNSIDSLKPFSLEEVNAKLKKAN
ncbi:glycosyltransferase family 4 protein [Elizabethkingia anophelis]|uniref:glycosyltransferase family 4 protein n=1 Tax=Elizabethkingia anophelis TaxID=1117645 RepID=UPI0012B2CD84|nr:glycosyltransferase family 4 protein [Elizabethkingia anophelis]QGN23092.1 glycosyltransferase [Elizabethkingia anophelis]QNV09741.1 glycosyltransferase [Elizabethkingia anophelis]UTF87883.1 glycosyltransferase family 4 protein [Elizabethkingia anophelis]UTF98763.1 glycosyltransferase family 4 protein [Elizabethkingia anophelis]UTG02519.1 glycosyltransferase family 4 protein [Elizabethkingia anophelis]